MSSCIQVKLDTHFTASHISSSFWPGSSTKMSILVTSLWRSTSEPALATAVADECASSSGVCANERWCATCTAPYRIFNIHSLGSIFVRNSYRIFVAPLQ